MVQDGRFTLLKSFESFGAYFGCSADLYEIIPRLHKFYATRQLEITTGRDLGCSLDFKRLLFELSSWRPIQDRSQDHYNHTEMWLNDIGGYQRSEHRAAQDEANKRREFEQSPMIAAAYAPRHQHQRRDHDLKAADEGSPGKVAPLKRLKLDPADRNGASRRKLLLKAVASYV
ncbi:hypothetical protein NW754_003971 [Fusarium falciforme]|nr:hypothetical protein NW754_003971 [Fusarium falciforme]